MGVRSRLGRGPLAAVLIFCGVMLPALGFFNIYFMLYSPVADHFQYHASVALIAAGVGRSATMAATRLGPQGRPTAVAGAGIVLGVLLVLAFRQTFIYHDLETLYRDTIEKNPQSWIAYLNLSTHLDFLGRDEEACDCATGLRVKPDSPHARLPGECAGPVERRRATTKTSDGRRWPNIRRPSGWIPPTRTGTFRWASWHCTRTRPRRRNISSARWKHDPRNARAVYGRARLRESRIIGPRPSGASSKRSLSIRDWPTPRMT